MAWDGGVNAATIHDQAHSGRSQTRGPTVPNPILWNHCSAGVWRGLWASRVEGGPRCGAYRFAPDRESGS